MNLPLELESLLRPKLSTIQSKRYCFLSCHVNWKTHWGEPERAPHYSGTALRKCVNVRTYVLACLRPYTVNFKYAFKYFPKIEVKGNTGPECSVDNHSGDSSSLTPPGTLLLVCHNTYGLTINGRLLADRKITGSQYFHVVWCPLTWYVWVEHAGSKGNIKILSTQLESTDYSQSHS